MAFSYEGLDKAVADKLKAMVPKIKAAIENERQAAIAVGNELIAAKDILRNRGEAFVLWLRDECGLNPRSASRYMATSRMFGDVPAQAAKTSAQVLYGLAQAKAVTPAAKGLIRKIRQGQIVSLAEYRKATGSVPAARTAAGDKPANAALDWWKARPSASQLALVVTLSEFNTYAHDVNHIAQTAAVKPAAASKVRKRAQAQTA